MTDVRDRDPEVELKRTKARVRRPKSLVERLAQMRPDASGLVTPKDTLKETLEEPPRVEMPPALVPRIEAPAGEVAPAEVPRDEVQLLEASPSARRQLELRTANLPELRPRRKFNAVLWSLIVVIVLPIIASGVYLFAYASDQYVAETQFAVRKADAGPDGIGSGFDSDGDEKSSGTTSRTSTKSLNATSIMAGTVNLAGEDAGIIANYIHSRKIIDDISKTVDVRAIYSRPEADFWARLPADADAEAVTRYWKSMVSVYVEATSGILRVSASAFRREDALALTRAILQSSTSLVNAMSLEQRQDQIKLAESEVVRNEGEVRGALAALTEFRNSARLIDPVKSSESSGKILLQLMSDKIEAEARVFVAQRAQGLNAPGLTLLQAKVDTINAHIAEVKGELAGDKAVTRNMASTLARFEELDLKRQFAERMYGFARDGVERARLTALEQSVYLAVFVPPSLPQDFTYPARYTDFALISLAAFMVWICGATIIASVLDHRL